MVTKKGLSIILSKLKSFSNQNIKLEQYSTDADIASDILWCAKLNKDIKGKVIADLGCGNGILGLGALILGAKKVYFLDIDKTVIKIAKDNKKLIETILNKKLNAEFVNKSVQSFNKKVDVVIQNPPFGVKVTHSDKLFLIKAMEIANTIYTFHKYSTKNFIERFVKDNKFYPKLIFRYKFPLKRTYWFHLKKVKYIDVGVWYLCKLKAAK